MNAQPSHSDDPLSRPASPPRRGVGPTNPFTRFTKEAIEQSLSKRFEQQVAENPQRLAVKSTTHELTYAELNEGANRVAHAILAQRGTAEEPIALLLEHDAPMLAALLGVLKGGKIFVPLDPSHPTARNRYILEDSQAGLIVTSSRNLPMAREMAQGARPFINIDELDASSSTPNPGRSLSPDNLAWILYTSGSTGRPKGVVQNHRNVLHFVMTYTNGLHIGTDDRLGLVFSLCVNAGAHEIFSALLNGAALCLLNLKEEGVARLGHWLVEQKITIISCVPTVFRHFASSLTGAETFSRLRLIKLLGEPLYRRDVELYKKHFSRGCILVNRLGSTETGTIRWFFMDGEVQVDGNMVPVGYPVEDNEILLLDETTGEDGTSRVGEIAVRSRYLFPGYWQRPGLTRAAFLPDPVGRDERIYRTGDLGRMLPDGCLIHLGRKDFQKKIGGRQIEAGEIEMALLDHCPVQEAAAVVREDRPGDPRLVAYVVPKAGVIPTVTALRHRLAVHLPEYMIPSTFVVVDSLPKAPNGKVYLAALPAPERARPNLENPFRPPRTPIERRLARIWCEVLGIVSVGVLDNFLELGGTSLHATQVISRLRSVFHVDLPLREFFQVLTVEHLAGAIAQRVDASVARESLATPLSKNEDLAEEE